MTAFSGQQGFFAATPAGRGGLTSWSKLLEHVPEFAVELVRLLQHRVVADAVDGDRPEVGVLFVGLDGRGGEELVSAGGVDAPHRHLGLLEQLPRVEAEEVAHEGQRHLRVLTFGIGLEPRLQLGVRLLREQPGDRHTDRLLEILLDAVEDRLAHLLGQFELGVLQGIDADHGDDRPRHPLGGQQRDRLAHLVADEDQALQAQRLDHRLDVAGQAVGGPRLAALAGLAVPGLVESDDSVIGVEHLDLVLPVLAVAGM
jgi:hypothetical protein